MIKTKQMEFKLSFPLKNLKFLLLFYLVISCATFGLKSDTSSVKIYPGHGAFFRYVIFELSNTTNESLKCKFLAVANSNPSDDSAEVAINEVKYQAIELKGNLIFGEYKDNRVQIAGSSSWTGQGPHIYYCNNIEAVIKSQKEFENQENSKKIQHQAEENKNTEEQKIANQKGIEFISKNGLDFQYLMQSFNKLQILNNEKNEFEKKGQSIKAKKIYSEIETFKKELKTYFYKGKLVKSSNECKFVRPSRNFYSDIILDPEIRQFTLSCFEGVNLIFRIRAVDDSDVHWPKNSRTENEIVEKFESTQKFAGTIEIVDAWVYSDAKEVGIQFEEDEQSKTGNIFKIIVHSKIQKIQ